jgi:hypothetical protein
MYLTRVMGSVEAGIVHLLLDILHRQHVIRAVRDAIATIDTNLSLVLFRIPEHCTKRTRFHAIIATNALGHFEGDTTPLSRY